MTWDEVRSSFLSITDINRYQICPLNFLLLRPWHLEIEVVPEVPEPTESITSQPTRATTGHPSVPTVPTPGTLPGGARRPPTPPKPKRSRRGVPYGGSGDKKFQEMMMKNAMGNIWYPLVNVYITMERSTIKLMGKLTISTGPFSIAMLVITRG